MKNQNYIFFSFSYLSKRIECTTAIDIVVADPVPAASSLTWIGHWASVRNLCLEAWVGYSDAKHHKKENKAVHC